MQLDATRHVEKAVAAASDAASEALSGAKNRVVDTIRQPTRWRNIRLAAMRASTTELGTSYRWAVQVWYIYPALAWLRKLDGLANYALPLGYCAFLAYSFLVQSNMAAHMAGLNDALANCAS